MHAGPAVSAAALWPPPSLSDRDLRVFCHTNHCTAAGKVPREGERKGYFYPLTDGSYLNNKGMGFLNPLPTVNFKKKGKWIGRDTLRSQERSTP